MWVYMPLTCFPCAAESEDSILGFSVTPADGAGRVGLIHWGEDDIVELLYQFDPGYSNKSGMLRAENGEVVVIVQVPYKFGTSCVLITKAYNGGNNVVSNQPFDDPIEAIMYALELVRVRRTTY